jgi:hypothetical protein
VRRTSVGAEKVVTDGTVTAAGLAASTGAGAGASFVTAVSPSTGWIGAGAAALVTALTTAGAACAGAGALASATAVARTGRASAGAMAAGFA